MKTRGVATRWFHQKPQRDAAGRRDTASFRLSFCVRFKRFYNGMVSKLKNPHRCVSDPFPSCSPQSPPWVIMLPKQLVLETQVGMQYTLELCYFTRLCFKLAEKHCSHSGFFFSVRLLYRNILEHLNIICNRF